MKRSKTLLVCVITLAIFSFTPVSGQEFFFSTGHEEELIYHSANTLFDFAEREYPEIFPGPEATQILREGDGPWAWPYWFFRFYADTNTYLAVKSDFTVYVYGPAFGPDIVAVGNLIDVMDAVSPIIDPGSEECVDIGYPEVGTVAGYSGTYYDHPAGSQITWQDGGDGLKMVREKSRVSQQESYQDVNRVVSIDGMDYIKWSSRVFDQPIIDVYMGDNVSITLRKTESTYDTGLLLGPTGRFCVGQRWYSPRVPVSEFFYSSLNHSPAIIQSAQSDWTIGIVNAINTPVTVPAGEFVTVETTIVRSWEVLTRWTDIETGIIVKETAYAPGIGHFFTEVRRELHSITQY